MRCRFCQNYQIAAAKRGKVISIERLAQIFLELQEKGAANINLVTPTHFLPDILPALEPKLPVPVVYNCGGYESMETLRQLEGKIDVYLPDFKYSDNALAKKLSSAPDYFETASAAILEMYRQVGKPVIEGDEMKRGVLVRHLVLPGCVDNSLGVLDWVAEHFRSGDILFSLMSQYVPMGRAAEMPPFDRRITELEYDSVLSYMMLLGIEDGYTQDFSSAECGYTPSFDLTGL